MSTLVVSVATALATPLPSPSPTSSTKPSLPLSTEPSPPLSTEQPSKSPTGDDQAALRSQSLELAEAFSNDGYKIRDGFWYSVLPPTGQASLLTVNLFLGNQYWFCAAAAAPARRIVLKLYDENGHLVSTQFYEKGSTVALGAEPSHSGKYYLSIQLLEGAPADFCLLYSYK